MNELFRPEAVEHRHRRLLGEVSLAVPVRSWMLSLVVLSLFSLAVGVALFAKVATKEAAAGVVVASGSVVQVRSGGDWIVKEVLVREGQIVGQGQPLFVASSTNGADADPRALHLIGNSINSELGSLSRQGAELQTIARGDARSAEADRESDQANLRSLDEQIALQRRRVDLAAESLRQIEAKADQGFISKIELTRRQDQLLVAQQSAAQLASSRQSLARSMSQRAEDLQQRQSRNRLAEEGVVERAADALARKTRFDSERSFTVQAPMTGRIDLLLTSAGKLTRRGDVQLVIAPAQPDLMVEAYLPSRSMGFVKVGQTARIAFEAFPTTRYGYAEAVVSAIADTPLDPGDIPVAVRTSDPTYRIQLRLTGQFPKGATANARMRPGMRVNAYLALDRHPLWQALLKPLIGTDP